MKTLSTVAFEIFAIAVICYCFIYLPLQALDLIFWRVLP